MAPIVRVEPPSSQGDHPGGRPVEGHRCRVRCCV